MCPTDGVVLVPTDELPAPPVEDASLGVFHPATAVVVASLAAGRHVPVRAIEVDARTVELRVPADARDGLRAQLAVRWGDVVAAVPEEHRAAVADVGDRLVGWHDAPGGAWVDGQGRVRVEASAEEEAGLDAARRVGPVLSVIGLLGLLLAWISDGGPGMWLAAGAAVLLGLLLPL